MRKNSLACAAEFLLSHDDFVIVSHHLPDGDAAGSALALLCMLTENGKKATVFMPDGIPDKYHEFNCSGVETTVENLKSIKFDAMILLDTPSLERACGLQELNFSGPTLNIDHHPDNGLYADLNLVDPASAATAELIFLLSKELPEWTLSTDCLTLILLGIVTDSGCFRFANTSPKMMRVAADLLENDADLQKIVNAAYFSRPLNELQFEAELVSQHMQTAFDGRFVWISIPTEVIEKHQFEIKNTEVLIDSVRSVNGGLVAALLRVVPDGIKCSLRSKDPGVSVGRVARIFGGGGHEMAAGALIPVKTLAEAEKILLKHIQKELNNAL
jgi:bifunctional oligoribonuclease and PAP phosphatase NrnA